MNRSSYDRFSGEGLDDCEIERLDAAHEPVKSTDPSPPREPRFGERLRALAEGLVLMAQPGFLAVIRNIADAIDRDRDRMVREGKRRHIETQIRIEEVVERLKYGLTTWEGSSIIPDTKNQRVVLDAEPFLAELKRIFSERI